LIDETNRNGRGSAARVLATNIIGDYPIVVVYQVSDHDEHEAVKPYLDGSIL
jgi:hypothetical protein